ncbi:MAG: hypothetical protein ACSNEK_03685 [Parachlamydiaceae bacterium]
MDVTLSTKEYLSFFSYVSKGESKIEAWVFRGLKASSYIPMFGTISCLVFSVLCLKNSRSSQNAKNTKELRVRAVYLGLRAAFALAPPLLLLVEGVTTAVDAILPSKKNRRQ